MNPSQALQLWDQRGFSLGIELGGGGAQGVARLLVTCSDWCQAASSSPLLQCALTCTSAGAAWRGAGTLRVEMALLCSQAKP